MEEGGKGHTLLSNGTKRWLPPWRSDTPSRECRARTSRCCVRCRRCCCCGRRHSGFCLTHKPPQLFGVVERGEAPTTRDHAFPLGGWRREEGEFRWAVQRRVLWRARGRKAIPSAIEAAVIMVGEQPLRAPQVASVRTTTLPSSALAALRIGRYPRGGAPESGCDRETLSQRDATGFGV